MPEPHDGRRALHLPGFTYLPQFFSVAECDELIACFASLRPIWERRYAPPGSPLGGEGGRRLTRPVYWLGAWQFACLGYYAEPEHREDRCVRAEPLPTSMTRILDRLRPVLADDHADDHADAPPPADPLPNTCLVNYYGREVGDGVPVDFARLKMHRDGEPGPVVMISVGQPGLLEFLDPDRSPDPELAVWTRNRSVSILSGPDFKDRLYHRVSRVRSGAQPVMTCSVDRFELRRVSVSFRHVPAELIQDFGQLPVERRDAVRGYVNELSEGSEHWRQQLATERG